jgi:hypothetical protein
LDGCGTSCRFNTAYYNLDAVSLKILTTISFFLGNACAHRHCWKYVSSEAIRKKKKPYLERHSNYALVCRILAVLIQNTLYATGHTVTGKASEHRIVVEQGACKVGLVRQPTKGEEFELQVRSVI